MGKKHRTVSQEEGRFQSVAAYLYSGGDWKPRLVVKRESLHERAVNYICPFCLIDKRRRPILNEVSESAVAVEEAIVSRGFCGDVVIHKPEVRKRDRPTHICWNCGRFFRVIGTELGPVEDITQDVLSAVHW